MKENNNDQNEIYPMFPSGEWEGFYLYGQENEKHMMVFSLNFKDDTIEGSGHDDIGFFNWGGSYDVINKTCSMVKIYPNYTIEYDGNVNENGITGSWKSEIDLSNYSSEVVSKIQDAIKNKIIGSFNIWPKHKDVSLESEDPNYEAIEFII